eukprot:gb/GECG01007411.1/.p1 GENE.gb/GECG01007411.1/~~gb/GECG01007411.1/.p1  ORF type:complete len:173 (+),score=9.14 gb/GECG01007411.1/:1-519(+)
MNRTMKTTEFPVTWKKGMSKYFAHHATPTSISPRFLVLRFAAYVCTCKKNDFNFNFELLLQDDRTDENSEVTTFAYHSHQKAYQNMWAATLMDWINKVASYKPAPDYSKVELFRKINRYDREPHATHRVVEMREYKSLNELTSLLWAEHPGFVMRHEGHGCPDDPAPEPLRY